MKLQAITLGGAALLALVAAGNGSLYAQDVIYNGYNNETTAHAPGSLVTVGYQIIGEWYGERRAAQFQMPPGAHHVLEAIGLPVRHDGLLNLRLSIVTDDGDAPGATVLWSVVNPPQITPELAHRVIPAQALLQADEKYWLVLEPEDLVDAHVFWHVSSPAYAGREAVSLYGSSQWDGWNALHSGDRPAFRIYGRPLPPSLLLYNGYANDATNYNPGSSGNVGYENHEMMGEMATRRAAKFQAPGGAMHVVDAVGIPIYHQANQTLNLRMSIVPDDNGSPGSAALWAVTNPPQVTSEHAHRMIPALATLQPGADYWLILEPAVLSGDPFTAYWHTSMPPFAGIEAIGNYTSGSWGTWSVGGSLDRPAFHIHGRPLPEPADLELYTAVEIRFGTVPGSLYLVESTDVPGSENWTALGEPFMGVGGPTSIFHSIRGSARGVYRVWTE